MLLRRSPRSRTLRQNTRSFDFNYQPLELRRLLSVSTISPKANTAVDYSLLDFDDSRTILLPASDSNSLWIEDGNSLKKVQILPEQLRYDHESFQKFEGQYVFQVHGDLWTTDGTADGTQPIAPNREADVGGIELEGEYLLKDDLGLRLGSQFIDRIVRGNLKAAEKINNKIAFVVEDFTKKLYLSQTPSADNPNGDAKFIAEEPRFGNDQDFLAKANERVYFIGESNQLISLNTETELVTTLDGFEVERLIEFQDSLFFIGEELATRTEGVWTIDEAEGEPTLSLETFLDSFVKTDGRLSLTDGRVTRLEIYNGDGTWNRPFNFVTRVVFDETGIYYHDAGETPGFYRIPPDSQTPELLYETDQAVSDVVGLSGGRLGYISEDRPWITDFTPEGTKQRRLFRDFSASGEQTYTINGDVVYGFSNRTSTRTTVWGQDLATGARLNLGFFAAGAGRPFTYNNEVHFLSIVNSSEFAVQKIDPLTNQRTELFRANQSFNMLLDTNKWHSSLPGIYFAVSDQSVSRLDIVSKNNESFTVETGIIDSWATPDGSLVFVDGQNSAWRLDPTTGASSLLFQSDDSLRISGILPDAGIAFFAGNGKMWRTDGTIDGTEIILENEDIDDRDPGLVSNNRFYFRVGVTVWTSDGTREGTVPLIEAGVLGQNVASQDGFDYFVSGDAIIRSNGTAGGTNVEASLDSLSLSFGGGRWVAVHGKNILAFVTDFQGGSSVVRSDGTGPLQILGNFKGLSDVQSTEDGIVFNATQENSDLPSAWISDGTVSGTRKLFDYQIKDIHRTANGDYVFQRIGNANYKPGVLLGDWPTSKKGFLVSTTEDDGPGSLRFAIEQSEATPGPDTIRFELPNGSEIRLDSALPAIRDSVVMSYFDESIYGEAGQRAQVVIDGSKAGENATGLRIFADDVTVQGLSLINFSGDGILVYEADDVRIASNWIGTRLNDFDADSGNQKNGLRAVRANGIEIVNNFIGKNQRDGIIVLGENLGGLISENSLFENNTGIVLRSSFTVVTDNNIQSNRATGIGVFTSDGSDNLIDSNDIWSNGQHGIYVSADRVRTKNNLLGSNDLYGIYLKGADSNLVYSNGINNTRDPKRGVGGIRAVGSDLLSVFDSEIFISTGHALFVGGKKSTSPILINNSLSSIGETGGLGLVMNGASLGYVSRNEFNWNTGGGIYLQGNETNHTFFSNSIGYESFQLTPNLNYGMLVASHGNRFMQNRFVNEDRNIILYGDENRFEQNWFGTTPSGSHSAETGFEIFLGSDASGNEIVDNVFAQTFTAIRNRSRGSGNRFSQNEMQNSVQHGIDNGPYRLDANDPGDADEGPNRLQNHPTLTSVKESSGMFVVRYSVDTAPANASYPLTIEFFFAGNERVGETYLASDLFTESDFLLGTEKEFEFQIDDLEIPKNTMVVATATDADGNTSEFSFEVAIS